MYQVHPFKVDQVHLDATGGGGAREQGERRRGEKARKAGREQGRKGAREQGERIGKETRRKGKDGRKA